MIYEYAGGIEEFYAIESYR